MLTHKGVEYIKSIDNEVLNGYNSGIEKGRLRCGLGLIEFERTKELLIEHLPPPAKDKSKPVVIYDIGGGYGEYAWWLSSLGYEVHLFDISETNIIMSQSLQSEYPGVNLHSAEIADALSIDRPNESSDVVLFMGPLYHIIEKENRLSALKECYRLLKPSGTIFCSAISRFATLLWALTVYGVKNRLLDDNDFMNMTAHEIFDGEHIKPINSPYKGMGRSHFHSPDELTYEINKAGFSDTVVHGVIGGSWLAPNIDELWKNEESKRALMRCVKLLDTEKDILGLSTHLLSISTKV